MAAIQRKLVHKQFNSPMGLYSQQNVKETLNRELNAFGANGIEIDDQIPLNLANSAVLRAVEEEEQQQMKCESLMVAAKTSCERPSRSRQRYEQQRQRPHTPLHQQQLEQIKTQYLSHQHDITIDRDTVLKINRLATRRNLHKREHSWPPTKTTTTTTTTAAVHNEAEPLRYCDRNGDEQRNHEQHVRSTSNDNALQFDETVCKRHGIDVIREIFKSPTRIIEPTAKEVRQRRQQQQQQRRNHSQQCTAKNGGGVYDNGDGQVANTREKPKQMVNLVKHEELLRKNVENKSSNVLASNVPKIKDPGLMKNIHTNKTIDEDKTYIKNEDVYETHTIAATKGFSHPETKAADEEIGLVEPKRQYFEQLAACKKWCSYENLNANAALANQQMTAVFKPLHPRQSYSLERGRDVKQRHQLPPQKPRSSPKTQRRSMKLATEIKISYDADADQHNIQIKSLNKPKPLPDDLEHIPLPPTPPCGERKLSKELNSSSHTPVHEKEDNEMDNSEYKVRSDSKPKSFKEQHIYDDACIYLRSLDMQDNTVAYIPAAITIVPSPTEDIMQHWMASANLKANIKGIGDDTEMTIIPNIKQDRRQNEKSLPEAKQEQQQRQPQEQNAKQKNEPATYVTRLPTTPNGIQLTRQTSVNTKRNTQLNNTCNNTTPMPANDDAFATNDLAAPKYPQGIAHSNAETITTYFKTPLEGEKTQPTGIFYTDGEYLYGPYDPSNGLALAHATIRSLQAEQQRQQQRHNNVEIKKDIEAETRNQHKDEIANLTAKYEHIQKSITEHLRQIDAYIENAKTALTTTIATNDNNIHTDKPESLNIELDQQEQQPKPQHNLKATQRCETPLQEILRKITHIMQEVKPLHRKLPPEVTMENENALNRVKPAREDEENMPIVDKVLMDLNMLTTHLSQYQVDDAKTPTTFNPLEPITAELQEQTTPLHLQFDTRPYPTEASYVTITEDKTNEENPLDLQSHVIQEINEQTKQRLTNNRPSALTKPAEHVVNVETNYEKLLATDKLITAQTQSQPLHQCSHRPEPEKHGEHAKTILKTETPKDDKKNVIFDFITTRHQQQEQLVEPVIDTLEKLENESSENKTNTLTQPTTYDEQIKSNLNQQTTTSNVQAISTSTNKEKDVAIRQNCNTSFLTNAPGKSACNHDDPQCTRKRNESQLKLHIMNSADIRADKQFQKYDNEPTKNTNDDDVANNKPDQRQYTTYKHNKHDDDEPKNLSDSSSGSELSNTYKSSYELPSPYVTMRQISWEDMLPKGITSLHATLPSSDSEAVLTTTLYTAKSKHDTQIAAAAANTRKSTTETLLNIEPAATSAMTTGHVEMQSTTTSKPRIQTRHQPQQHHQHHQQHQQQQQISQNDDILHMPARKYPAALIEPHLPTRSTSPFGLNVVDNNIPAKQHRSPTPSPTRSAKTRSCHEELMQSIRKYPSPLVEPHIPTRATSPFGLNAIEVKNFKRSSRSSSPQQCKSIAKAAPSISVGDEPTRKYPASLVEPDVPTRAASPFGLNTVDFSNSSRATTPMPVSVDVDAPIRKYPASLVEPHAPKRAASPFGLNAVDISSQPVTATATTSIYHGLTQEVATEEDVQQQKQIDEEEKRLSPIRKYPQSLIEPNAPKRAASPFGLNIVDTKHKTRCCTSPARVHYETKEATSLQLSSNAGGDRKTTAYVPQVEGHNIGLLVRTPIIFNNTIPLNTTSHDYSAMTSNDFSNNRYCGKDDIARCNEYNNAHVADDDDDDIEVTSDELQRINTIASAKQVIQPKLRNLNTTDITRESMEQTTNSQQHDYQDHRSQHIAADTILLQTSVINRSFDNVSPRPYNTIEGYKRVAWPPASEERIVREFTPQPQTQYPPVPAYQQQQQQQQGTGAAVPSTQGPIYNNVQPQEQQHQHQTPTNTNTFARETISPYNQNQNQYEAYPPQQPETPIVLVDKQFSRQASHEPIQTNSVPYQQQQQLHQYQQQQQQQQPPMVQPQNQPMQQQHQPTYNQQIYQQQYQPNNQQNVSYPQQQQQEYQQTPLQQQEQNSPSTPVSGWKPIHAPQPKQDPCFTKPVVGANDASMSVPIYQQQFQNYHQQPQYQPEPQQQQQQQQYRAPSHETYQQPQQPQYQQTPQQQQQQYSPQPQYQAPAPAPTQNQYQPQYQGQAQQVPQYQAQPQQQPQYQAQVPQTQQYAQPPWVQQPQQPPQQQYQQPPWVQQPQQQQQPPQQQQYQQPQYQTPLNQYQAPHQQYQPQPQQNQFVSQPNQQFNSYSQPQQQQHTVSHDQLDNLQQPQQQAQSMSQDYRGASPGIITLRKEAPVTQKPAPVYTSQPAAVSFMGGANMRGDLKWPPPEYKEAAVKENQERRELAAGPVCRPRQVKRDYTTFFAKNALSHHYPSYKVPPGTQHMTY